MVHHHQTTVTTTTYYYAPQTQQQTTTYGQTSTGYFPGYGPGVQGYPPQQQGVYPPQQQPYPPQGGSYNQSYNAGGYYNPNASGIYPPTSAAYDPNQNAYSPQLHSANGQPGREGVEAYSAPPSHEGYNGSHSSAYYGLPDHQQNNNNNNNNNNGEQASEFNGLGDHASNLYSYDNNNNNSTDSSQFSGLGSHAFNGNYGQQQQQPQYGYDQQQYNQQYNNQQYNNEQYNNQQYNNQSQPSQSVPVPTAAAPVENKPMNMSTNVSTAGASIPSPIAGDIEGLQEKLSNASLSVPIEEKIDEGLPLNVEDKKGMMQAIVGYINTRLAGDALYAKAIPVQGDELFKLATDGVLFNKLLNVVTPGSVDERTVNSGSNLNVRQIEENVHLALNSARGLGCDVSRISVSSVLRGNQDKVTELLWAIINKGEISYMSAARMPFLNVLLRQGETMEELSSLSSSELLLRWFNYQLQQAGVGKRVNNLSSDLSDSEGYIYLINHLSNGKLSDLSALQNNDRSCRAETVVNNSTCILPGKFITANAITSGHEALNTFFVSQLFRHCPNMGNITLNNNNNNPVIMNSSPEREKRAFLNWINSLGIEPQMSSVSKNSLSDGLVLLQVLDKVQPGIVNWSKVHRNKPSKFQQLEHCNYGLELCGQLKISTVNISGAELQSGSEKLSLAVIWQVMRYHVLHFAGRQSLSEESIVKWANEKVNSTGRTLCIVDFKDKSISTSHFIIDLLTACRPGSIDYTKITMGKSNDQKLQNASYAISCARKLGCPSVFLLPEDIVEVNPNLIMTFFASIMSVYGPKN